MKTNEARHAFSARLGDTWCRTCNCTREEHATLQFLDESELNDYIASHGNDEPLREAEHKLALDLWVQGDDYATIAHEIVFRREEAAS